MRRLYLVAQFVLLVVLAPAAVEAAHLFVEPEETEYNRLDTFYVPVRIDAQGECVNAVRASVYFDASVVTVVDVSRGDSIVTLWTEEPQITPGDAETPGVVTFEGGIPGGYCGRVEGDPGRTDTLVRLVVTGVPKALSVGDVETASFVVDPASVVYMHDGIGTPASTTVAGAGVTLVQATGTPANIWLDDVRSDTISPELFDITLVEGPSEGNLRNYIVWNTTDKQSGISHYEVRETDPDRFGFLKWFPDRSSYWVEATSPYVLRDQKLTSKIMVKAIDKNGNERVVTYTPPITPIQEIQSPEFVIFLLLALVFIVLTEIVRRRYTARKRREQATPPTPQEPQPSDIQYDDHD
jgi:hypothetical protein